MRILASVVDVGVNYKVVSVLGGDEASIFDHSGVRYYEIPTPELRSYIEDALRNGKDVYLPKNIDYQITQADVIIQDIPDPISAERQGAKIRSKHFVAFRIGYLSMFDFFSYQILNNKLAAAGYIISDSNREEKYLEIVNSDNQDLIADLEEYLSLLDKLSERNFLYKQWMQFSKDLETATSVEQIQSMCDNFYSQFS